jgi:Flp pilus assembly protein TadG
MIKVFRMPSSTRIPHTTVVSLLCAKDEEGSSLVEFALIFVVMITMMLGIIDFCRAAYSYHFVAEVAREATRYAAVRGSTCNSDGSCSQATPDTGPAAPTNTVVQDYVTSITPPGIDSTKVTTTPTWCPAAANCPAAICPSPSNEPGCTVEVTVSYTFSFLFPLVYKPIAPSGTITLSSSSEMIISH